MRVEVTIKRTTISFGKAWVDAVDEDHAALIVANDPDILIPKWETASVENEVEQTKELS